MFGYWQRRLNCTQLAKKANEFMSIGSKLRPISMAVQDAYADGIRIDPSLPDQQAIGRGDSFDVSQYDAELHSEKSWNEC